MLQLPVETIGSRFGGIPQSLPLPALPSMTSFHLLELLPTAISFTLLGGVESLLSAKIADGMTGRRHRYNMELVAQGIANVGSALFGGICVTGTIARTATNIRAGARSPVAGMLHAVFLLPFIVPRRAPGLLHSPCCTCRTAPRRMLEHGGEARVCAPPPRLVYGYRCSGHLGLTLVADLTLGIIAGCIAAAAVAYFGRRTT